MSQSYRNLQSKLQEYEKLHSRYTDLTSERLKLKCELERISIKANKLRNARDHVRTCSIAIAKSLGLDQKTDFDKRIMEFPGLIWKRLENVRRIRANWSVINFDGTDLDIPDLYFSLNSNASCKCYPCDVHKGLQKVLEELPLGVEEVIRIRYRIPHSEKNMDASGQLTLQRYIALQLGVSEATISRRLSRARRCLRHPYRTGVLLALLELFDPSTPRCTAEYLVREFAWPTQLALAHVHPNDRASGPAPINNNGHRC
jgi:hypothetical protein